MLKLVPRGSLLVLAENARVHFRIRRARREVVEGVRRRADHVLADERCAFARAVLGMFQRALPLEHRPAVIVVLGELEKMRLKSICPSPGERKRPGRSTQP